jgi:hypothetical protein
VTKDKRSLRLTCKQAAALLIAREDQILRMPDRVALKLHLMACKTCPKFENQVLTMRAALNQWRTDSRETTKPDAKPPLHQPPKS